MSSFILGYITGSLVMFASIWSARHFRVDNIIERAPDFSIHPATIIEQDEAERVTSIEDSKHSDRDLTFDEIL